MKPIPAEAGERNTNMAHGDGIYQHGRAWWLQFVHNGERHQVSLGRGITRTVALELAMVKRADILRGLAGIGTKKKDLPFDKATELFLEITAANNRPNTVITYRRALGEL